MNHRYILIVLACMNACLSAYPQKVVLQDKGKGFTISHPFILEDREGRFSFQEVQGKTGSFTRSELKTPDFLGNLSRAIWYKVEVVNHSSTTDWFLEIKGAYMHNITLYLQTATGISTQHLIGDENFNSRPIHSNDPVFHLPLGLNEATTLYLRIDSKTLIRASMSIKTMQQLYESSTYVSYGNGFLTAIAAALLIYNLFVYFSLRERVYLYYILYIFLYIVHNNFVSGHLLAFFPGSQFLNSTLLLPMMGIASILFTNSFLQTKKYAPFIFRIRWVVAATYIIPLSIYFSGAYQLAIAVTGIVMYLLFIYWFAAGIMAYQNHFKPAIYYIVGFGALITCNTLFGLKIMGVLDESYWLDSALYIGTALEAIILSFALATKINFYKIEKEKIQQQAYQQAVNFSHELINMQEMERKRISSELHDSVGQKLIVIKNKVLLAARGNQEKKPVNDLAENVADVIQEIRNISYGLRPYQIDLLGLTQSIKSLAEEVLGAAGIDCAIHADNIDNIVNQEMQMNIYRIVQECLNNIAKHSMASSCSIDIAAERASVVLRIADNGIGFDYQPTLGGMGIRGIRERLQILKGNMKIERGNTNGTTTTIEFSVNS